MQVFASITLKSLRRINGKAASTFESGWFDVARLIGPLRFDVIPGRRGVPYIYADLIVDEDLKPHLSVAGFNPDGTVRVRVNTNTVGNRRILAAFLASGDLERDVREVA